MAESYGGWSNHQRVWFSYSVTHYETSSYVSVTAYLQLDGGSSSIGTWSQDWSGYWGSGSQSPYWNIQPNESRAIAAGSYWVAQTDSAQTISFYATGRSYFGAVSHGISIGIPVRVPVAPSSLSVARSSDSVHSLSWTRGSTYTGAVVQRATDGGAWAEIARPAGNVSSFTDQTTQANRKYDYRVAGLNARGQSGWSNTFTVYTTPAAPAALAAEKVGFNIAVTATGLPPYATAYDVYDNGVLVGADVTSFPWTHVTPDTGVTHTYTVKSKRSSLVSAFSGASNTVQLLAAPNAPANLTPNGGTVASDAFLTLTWTHNPVDTTAQTAAEVEYRYQPSGTWLPGSGVGSTSAMVFGYPAAGSVLEWRVRTKGDHPDWSPWSAVATVDAITRPGVAVTDPAGAVGISYAVAEWTWAQAQSRPQSAWKSELIRNGVLVEAATGSGPATSHAFTTPLIDGGTYTVRAQAAAGDVWSAWGVETFTTIFPPPAAPDVIASWVESTGKHSLQVSPGELAVYAWTGVENESPSTMTVGASVTTNLVPNALMSGAVTGWVSTGGTPAWNEGLSVILAPGEGVYIDLGVVTDPLVSARALISAATPYRLAVFDPTGTSMAHWSDEYSGETDVFMEGLTVEAWHPLRVYVSLDAGGPLNISRVTVVSGGTVSRAFDGNSSDEVATEYMSVERSVDGVNWEPVAAALVGESVIQDGEGLSFGSTWYRVTAVSDLPSIATTVVEVVSDSDALWLSGGIGFAVTARLPFNPKPEITPGRARAAFRYAGRPLPVAYAGEAVARQVNVSGRMFDNAGEVAAGVEAMTALAQHPSPVHLFRDPDGRRIYGMVSDVPMPRETVGVWAYSFTLTETDH